MNKFIKMIFFNLRYRSEIVQKQKEDEAFKLREKKIERMKMHKMLQRKYRQYDVDMFKRLAVFGNVEPEKKIIPDSWIERRMDFHSLEIELERRMDRHRWDKIWGRANVFKP